jgi:hypothetical protein
MNAKDTKDAKEGQQAEESMLNPNPNAYFPIGVHLRLHSCCSGNMKGALHHARIAG